MNKGIIFSIGVVVGAAVGSLLTWKILEAKYERVNDEEYEDYDEYDEYKEIADGYCMGAEKEDDEKEDDKIETEREDDEMPERPYVITPEEFDEIEDYEAVTLTYYADGVVAYEDDDILTDEEVDYYIGKDSLETFGQYEEDSVFVRNDVTKSDYEILKDVRKYSEIVEG